MAVAAVAAVGMAISTHLLIGLTRNSAPLCLVGACEEVAASSFARFLGVPNSALGLLMYTAVALVSVVASWNAPARQWASPALLGLAVFGAAFSAYLTWLQVAVLQAVCAWCAASATLWVVLLVLSLVGAALVGLAGGDGSAAAAAGLCDGVEGVSTGKAVSVVSPVTPPT